MCSQVSSPGRRVRFCSCILLGLSKMARGLNRLSAMDTLYFIAGGINKNAGEKLPKSENHRQCFDDTISHFIATKLKKEKWDQCSDMTSRSCSDTFVSSCTFSHDKYAANINQSKFMVSNFQATLFERLSTLCHVCSWHEEKAAAVHALPVFGLKGGITRIFWPHPSSLF